MAAEKMRHLKSHPPVASSCELGCHAIDSTVDLCFLIIWATHQSYDNRDEEKR